MTRHIFAKYELRYPLQVSHSAIDHSKLLLVLNALNKSLLQTFEVLILSFVQSPYYGTILNVCCNVAIWEQVSIGGTAVGHFV